MERKDTLIGALAMGYCTERNENKITDPDLIKDMAKEVKKWIIKKLQEYKATEENLIEEKDKQSIRYGNIIIDNQIKEIENETDH